MFNGELMQLCTFRKYEMVEPRDIIIVGPGGTVTWRSRAGVFGLLCFETCLLLVILNIVYVG